MSIVDCAHHAEVRTHTKRKLQLHCQLQAAHILAASAALLISFFIHRSICHISTCVFIVDVHNVYRLLSKYDIPESTFFQRQDTTCLRFMATDKSLIQKLRWVWYGMVITQHFWEHEVQHKVIRRFRWVWGEFLDVWMAGKYSKKPHESRFSLSYYIILICILLKFGRKTSTTIFTMFKLGTFPWTCRVHFKNMSHITHRSCEIRNKRVLVTFLYSLAILQDRNSSMRRGCAAPTNTSTVSFEMLRTVAKQGAPHTSQGCSSQPGNVGGWLCARIPCHTDFTFDIVPWDLTSTLRVIHSTPSQKRYLETVLLLYVHCFFVSFRSIHEHLSSLCQW